MPLGIGETFAGYRIVRLLGSGGMGEVYLAQHPRLPRQDALKILRAEVSSDEEFRRRFINEAEFAAAISHPNIVTVHDRGECDGQLWIASQYVDGTDCAQLLSDSYPEGAPAELVAVVITAVASALDHAHDLGLLHRDIKPANILLSQPDRNGNRHVYLADFGIAQSLTEPNGLTATNMTMGTFAYSAPEQLLGEGAGDKADQYSLAATAYHLLVGSRLYPSSNVAAVINHQLNTPPPKLSDARPELARLDPILQIALAKRPEDRFRRCEDFARAFAEQSTAAGQHGPLDPTLAAFIPRTNGAMAAQPAPESKRTRTRFVLAAATTGIVLVGAVLLAWRPWQGQDASPGYRGSVPAAAPAVPSGPVPASAHDAAEAIKAAVPQITELIDLTEETDGNHLLGRPNGFVASTVMVDSRAECGTDGPGVDCGGAVEQWPDEAAARRRADYIQQIRASMPMLGSEWTTVHGALVLRVTGELPPSAQKTYEATFAASKPSAGMAPPPNSKEALEIRAHELDVLASRGDAQAAYAYYSQRCKNEIGELASYEAFLKEWLKGRNPQYSETTARVDGASGRVVSIDNDPNAPASALDPRTWTFIDGRWMFDNC